MLRFILLFVGLLFAPSGWTQAEQEAKDFVVFSQEFEATCVSREAVQILVNNAHPTRKIRVWLDRYHMGVGTGDRSKTDLHPAAAPEPLGCSRTLSGPQEWRMVRAEFINE